MDSSKSRKSIVLVSALAIAYGIWFFRPTLGSYFTSPAEIPETVLSFMAWRAELDKTDGDSMFDHKYWHKWLAQAGSVPKEFSCKSSTVIFSCKQPSEFDCDIDVIDSGTKNEVVMSMFRIGSTKDRESASFHSVFISPQGDAAYEIRILCERQSGQWSIQSLSSNRF